MTRFHWVGSCSLRLSDYSNWKLLVAKFARYCPGLPKNCYHRPQNPHSKLPPEYFQYSNGSSWGAVALRRQDDVRDSRLARKSQILCVRACKHRHRLRLPPHFLNDTEPLPTWSRFVRTGRCSSTEPPQGTMSASARPKSDQIATVVSLPLMCWSDLLLVTVFPHCSNFRG